MHSSFELGCVYVIEDAVLSSTFLPSPLVPGVPIVYDIDLYLYLHHSYCLIMATP